MKKKAIAVIPARAGSKGLIDKNIKMIAGLPLIAHTIIEAKKCSLFDVIHVSTDSKQYAEIASRYGADVPFLRSEEYSRDESSTWDAVKYVVEMYYKIGYEFEYICVLQPTSPLRDAEDICGAFRDMTEKDASCIVSVCQMEHSPFICGKLQDDLSMQSFFENDVWNVPRQELPVFYRINGAIYLLKKEALYKETIYDSKTYAYVMKKNKSIDIDEIDDFMIAELLLRQKEISER